tara:strand:- start:40 stop:987 length:948 start_codon:yes stop_codon:yes gene_type:complete
MSCNITSGIANGCNTNIGGVKNVYLANSATGTWYTYEMDKGTASLVETYNVNQAASILGFTQTLTIQLSKMAADKQQQIEKIAEANSMLVRVETNNGELYEFGNERGAYLVSGTTTTGIAYGDANQSELVIQADSKQSMTPQGFYGTLTGSWTNYMGGCSNYPPSSTGGSRLPAVLTNVTGNIQLVESYPGSPFNTKIVWESGLNSYRYKVEAMITTSYNSNAFDSSGNSVARWSSGTMQSTINPTGLVTVGEPTQPGIETTFKVICEFDVSSGVATTDNGLRSYTSLDCATTTLPDREFSGPATAFITITRTVI